MASVVLLVLDWRSGKLFHAEPRDPPFAVPSTNDLEEGDQEDPDVAYTPQSQGPPVSVPQVRYDPPDSSFNPFSDANHHPVPTSTFTTTAPSAAPPSIQAGRPSIDAYGAFSDPAPSGFGTSSPPPPESPRISRTMQYADPYAAVRASVAGGYAPSVPPSYEPYPGYR